MSENKTFIYTPESSGANAMGGFASMLAPLMQRSGIDPNVLLAMNNGGMGNNGSWFLWIIVILALFRNGAWGASGSDGMGGVSNIIYNDQGRGMLGQAIAGNRTAISELATNLNCSVNAIQTAINAVQSSVANVGSQVGMSGMQVVNAIQAGNASLASQLAQCCCDNKLLAAQNQAATMSRIDQLANGITQGFSATAYATQQQTCDLQNALRDTSTASTNAIIAKLDSMENAAMQDKIQALREKNSALTTQINLGNQNLATQQIVASAVNPLGAAISALQSDVASIKANQVPTINVPNPPGVLIPNCVAFQMGLNALGGFPYANGGQFG